MTITQWLTKIITEECPDDSIIAFNFGLYKESDKGYMIYLVGSASFDAEDAAWAEFEDYAPAETYLPLQETYTGIDREIALEKIIIELKSILRSDLFQNSFLKRAQVITVGFDDEDLVRIK